MNRRWAPLLAVLATATLASPLAAQSTTNISIIPVAGLLLPGGKWTDDDTIRLSAGRGIFVGLVAELGLNKNLSLMAQATRTLGLTQTLTFESPQNFTGSLETDMTTTQLTGGVIFRPLGRLPSGAPKTVYFELGGGLMLYNVSKGFVNPSGQSGELDFNSSSAMVMGGLGLSFPAGPRASVQLFGRVNYQLSKYQSDGLDAWNLSSPATTSVGKSSMVFQFGAGLRIGR